MKNNFYILILFFSLFFLNNFKVFSEEMKISSNKIKIDNINKITIFDGKVLATDDFNNKFFSDFAKYTKDKDVLESKGKSKLVTNNGYTVEGQNIIFDNLKSIVTSNNKTKITDKDGNIIYVDMFNYYTQKNVFFSKGNIKLTDTKNNIYYFSELYIDEKENKIVGSDVKAFLNDDEVKVNKDNDPRFFANSMTLSKNLNKFEKGVVTYCKDRGDDKCPPWALQSKEILHDTQKKTIYYKNAILKIYDYPIFMFPRFSHPDPTVKRRSGFLVSTYTKNTTVGSGVLTPYFWAINKDKDLTFTPKFYFNENPVLLAEYRQDFRNSNLTLDTSFHEGYKKETDKKQSGSRTHMFLNYNQNLLPDDEKISNIELKIQHVSNSTYFKIHDINSTLVNSSMSILESDVNYNYQDQDIFFGATFAAYEDLLIKNNDKYEYLLPYLTFEKNILSDENIGNIDFTSNLRIRNYDTDKQLEQFVNDVNWKSNKWIDKFGFNNQLQGLVKTVNYESRNDDLYKSTDANAELNGVAGYLSKMELFKINKDKNFQQSITPKFFFRYAPGHMRNIRSSKGNRLSYANIFELNKINQIDIIENGLSLAIGTDFKKNTLDKNGTIGKEKFSIGIGQVISEKENFDIPSQSSLNQQFSDLVGTSSFNINKNIDLTYNFSLDQNYKEFNYNDIGAEFTGENTKFNINYLEERNHIGNSQYVKSDFDVKLYNNTELGFSTKRNLLTNSSEFYNLSYNYINDCLKAGVAYRREFYTDQDLEPADTLMFTISIVPFGGFENTGLQQ